MGLMFINASKKEVEDKRADGIYEEEENDEDDKPYNMLGNEP